MNPLLIQSKKQPFPEIWVSASSREDQIENNKGKQIFCFKPSLQVVPELLLSVEFIFIPPL